MPTMEYTWVWCGVDARHEDKMLWDAWKKLLEIGAKDGVQFVEVLTVDKLVEVEEKLESNGWVCEVDDDETNPIILKGMLTVWKKQHKEMP